MNREVLRCAVFAACRQMCIPSVQVKAEFWVYWRFEGVIALEAGYLPCAYHDVSNTVVFEITLS